MVNWVQIGKIILHSYTITVSSKKSPPSPKRVVHLCWHCCVLNRIMLRYGLETTTRLILRVPQDQGLLDWWSKKRRLYYYIQRSSSNKIIVVKTFFCARIRCCFFTHACTRYKTKIESQHSHTHPDSPTFFVVTVSLVICHNVSSNICNFSFHSTIKSMNIINFEKKNMSDLPPFWCFCSTFSYHIIIIRTILYFDSPRRAVNGMQA